MIIASHEFDQDFSRALTTADRGPVYITDRGRPAYVLLRIEDYHKLAGQQVSLAEALAQPDAADFEFIPPTAKGLIRPPDEF